MITTSEIARILALAEHRHFGRAAEAIGITQPALTHCIAHLEKRLGAKVVDRGRWGMELTEVGRLIVERGHKILVETLELKHEIDQLQGLEIGKLTVTLAPYAAKMAGHEAVARLTASHPAIRCRVRVADWRGAADDVLEGRSEIGLADVREARSHPELETEPVARHRLHFFCRSGHPLLEREPLELSDLMDYPWAATRAPIRVVAHFPRDLGRAGTWEAPTGDFLPSVELDVVHDIARIALKSEIVIGATLSMVESEVASGDLVPVPLSTPWFHLEYGLICRKHRTLSPVAHAFADHLSEIENENQEREATLHDRRWNLSS